MDKGCWWIAKDGYSIFVDIDLYFFITNQTPASRRTIFTYYDVIEA